MADDRPVLVIGHSPDPDDAFMWWALGGENADPACDFDTGSFRYQSVADDIESLNRRSESGELDITALSCAQYPYVADRYVLTACGASIGEQFGPKIVSRRSLTFKDLHNSDVELAIPGERTSAFAATSILLGPGSFRYTVVPFDRIIPGVAAGDFAAGLVIHEGQLTFAEAGLREVADLGMLWSSRCGLPLPLGINVVRRDLEQRHGPGTLQRVARDLRRCLDFALAHRDDALAYALGFGRGVSPDLAERFIGMYVNRWTLDLGDFGRAAVQTFLQEAHRVGLTPDAGEVEVVG